MEQRARIRPSLPVANPTVSYWQDPPASIQNNPANLPQDADYVIIGSGISGTAIAWNLIKEKEKGNIDGDTRIIMLEARAAVSGATGRNGGHTKAASYRTFIAHADAHGVEEAVKIARLELANIRATHALARRYASRNKYIATCESQPCRTVDVIYDEDTMEQGVKAIALMKQELGPNDEAAQYNVHRPDEASKRFLVGKTNEHCHEQLKGAFEYEAGSISAYRFTIGMLDLCLEKGLGLHTWTSVTNIEAAPTSSATGKPWQITTTRGTVRAKNVMVATNGYTSRILPLLQGVIVPMKGQIQAQRPGASMPEGGLQNTYSFIYRDGYEYMMARPQQSPFPGDIVIGGGLGRLSESGQQLQFGGTRDNELDPDISAYLKDSAKGYFGSMNWGADPEGRERRVRREWTGIMGATADGLPLVGRIPGREGLYISAGFNGHGMVLCLKSAEALVQNILGKEAEVDRWFPSCFTVSEKRLREAVFEGRKDMARKPGKETVGVLQKSRL